MYGVQIREFGFLLRGENCAQEAGQAEAIPARDFDYLEGLLFNANETNDEHSFFLKPARYAYSGRIRPAFRFESGHRSGGNPASIPVRLRPPFRSNPASVK